MKNWKPRKTWIYWKYVEDEDQFYTISFLNCRILFFRLTLWPGADVGFSRGGGADFRKIFQNFDDLFFRSTKLIFRALPKYYFAPILGRFWALFEKFWQKNCVFFGARSPSDLVYIGAKGAFRKILGSVGQKWISEKVSKGDPLGRHGVESLRRGRPPSP